MKPSFNLLLCLLVPLLGFGQRAIAPDTPVQSLYQHIQSLPAGREKIDRLNALAEGLLRNDPSLAVSYAEEALSLAEDAEYPLGIVQACLTLGSLDTDLGHSEVAVEYISKALQLSGTHGFKQQRADAYRMLGNVFLEEGDLPGAEVNYKQALLMAREIGDSVSVAKSLNNLGMIKTKDNNYLEAVKYFSAAADVMRSSGNHQLAGIMYNNIGSSYTSLGDYRKADLFLDRAEKVYQSFTDLRGQAYVMQSRAENLAAQKLYPAAINGMEQAVAAFEQLKVPADIGDARIVYAHLLAEAKQAGQALEQLQQTLVLGIQSEDPVLCARSCYEIALLTSTTQPAKAEEAFKKGCGFAETADDANWLMQLNRAYAGFLIQQKRPAEAAACLEKCMALLEARRIPWREWYEVYDLAAKTYNRLQNSNKASASRRKYDECLAQKTAQKP